MKTVDGVSVDIHELKYKGGACKPVGTPTRMIEQSSSQSPEDMASCSRQKDSSPRHEPESLEVLSQTELMSDAGANSSEDEEIATQIPRKKGPFSKSHHVGGGVRVTEGILNVLESFQERKTAIKRPSSISDDPPVKERTSKRRQCEQSPKSAPSPTAQNGDREHSSFGDDPAPAKNAKDNAILDDTMDRTCPISATLSSINRVDRTEDTEIRQTSGIPQNKALSDHFHIGLKSLPKKFVSPPKSQLQYLAHHAGYINPKLPLENQFVGVSPCVLQELRILPATAETSTEPRSDAALKQTLEHGAEEMDIAKPGDEDVTVMNRRRPPRSASPTKSDGRLGEDTQQENYADSSNAADEAIPWTSSPVRPARCRDDLLPAEVDQTSPAASPDKQSAVSINGLEDNREPESSPSRLPSLKPLNAPHIWPMASAASRNVTSINQVPSSSLGLEDELEQQVPVALDSSGEYPHVSIKSPSLTSRIMLQSSPRSPAVEIGRSPYPDWIRKDSKRSLLRAAISKGTSNTGTQDTRAISSDPIIPATCVDSQKIAASKRGSQDQALQAASPATRSSITHRILVPATIPSRAVNTLHARMLNSSQPDISVIPGTMRWNEPTSPFGRPHSEGAPDKSETRRGSISVADEGRQRALKSKMDVVNIPANGPSRRKAKLLAPDFSQLSSSADTADMTKANRRSFFAQPDEHGEADADEAARIRSTSANLGCGDTKGGPAGPKLKSTRRSTTPSARVTQSYPKSGRHASLQVDSNSKGMEDMVERRQSPPAFASPSRGTVFENFKLAYPQFRHDRSKFIMACSYIKWLRDNRKVMPLHQSLFDDFIRFFCGPYSEYVRDQSASELPTETPVDFYNRFLEPEFTSRIVTLATLAEALEGNADLAAKHSKRLRRISSRFVRLSVTATPEQQEQPDLAVSSIRPFRQASVDLGAPVKHEIDHRPVRKSSPILGEAAPMELAHKEAIRKAEPFTGPSHRLKNLRESESTKAVVSKPTSFNFTTPNVAPVGQVVILDQKGTPTQIYIPRDDMEADLLPKDVPERRGRNRYSLPGRCSHE